MRSGWLVGVVAMAVLTAGCAAITAGRRIERHKDVESTGRTPGRVLPTVEAGLSVASVALTDDALEIGLMTDPVACVAAEIDVLDVYEVTERGLKTHGKVFFGIELGCTGLAALFGLTFLTGAFQDDPSSSLADVDPIIAGATSLGVAGACALGSLLDIGLIIDGRRHVGTDRRVIGHRPARCRPAPVANGDVRVETCFGEGLNLKTDDLGVVRVPVEVLATPDLSFCTPLLSVSADLPVYALPATPRGGTKHHSSSPGRRPTVTRTTEVVDVPVGAGVAVSLARKVDRKETYAAFLRRFPESALRSNVEKRVAELDEIERAFWERIEVLVAGDDPATLEKATSSSRSIPGSDSVLVHAALLRAIRDAGDAHAVRERLRTYLGGDLPPVLRLDARRRLIHWSLFDADAKPVPDRPEKWFVDLPAGESIDVYAERDESGSRVARLGRGGAVAVFAKGSSHWLLLAADPADLSHRKPLVAWIRADRLTRTDLAAEDAHAAMLAECGEMLERAEEPVERDHPDTMLATLDNRIDDARLSCDDVAAEMPWSARLGKLDDRRIKLEEAVEAWREARGVVTEIEAAVYSDGTHAEALKELRALRKRTDAKVWRAALTRDELDEVRGDVAEVYVEAYRRIYSGYSEVVRLEKGGGGARAKELRRAVDAGRRSLCLLNRIHATVGGDLGALKEHLLRVMKSGLGGGEGTAIFRFLTTGKCK